MVAICAHCVTASSLPIGSGQVRQRPTLTGSTVDESGVSDCCRQRKDVPSVAATTGAAATAGREQDGHDDGRDHGRPDNDPHCDSSRRYRDHVHHHATGAISVTTATRCTSGDHRCREGTPHGRGRDQAGSTACATGLSPAWSGAMVAGRRAPAGVPDRRRRYGQAPAQPTAATPAAT